MAKRVIVTVRWNKTEQCWVIAASGEPDTWVRLTKRLAVRMGREVAHGYPLSQLRVFNKNGRIAFEHTYGKDPRRYKG